MDETNVQVDLGEAHEGLECTNHPLALLLRSRFGVRT